MSLDNNAYVKKRFKKIYIEITNLCNLACDFCPQTLRQPEFMDIRIFNNILDQIQPFTDYVYLHVKGEPLLHKEIDDFLDLCGEKGFKVNLTTNGTLVSMVKDKIMFKPSLRQINFSLHSIGGNADFVNKDRYLEDIFSFTREAVDKTNMIIAYRLWNLSNSESGNLNDNSHLLDIIKSKFNLDYDIHEKAYTNRGIKISERVFLNLDDQFQWPSPNTTEDAGRGFCYGLRNQAAILVDGTVVPCCLDGDGIINLGNIKNNSFSNIINSERANELFNGFSKRTAVEELCRKCSYRNRFGL